VRQFRDDDYDEEGNGPYDRKYPGKRVIADQGRVRVPVYLTDGAGRSVPLMDARMREHRRLLDGYTRIGAAAAGGTAGHRPGQVSLSDADIRAARSRSEHARAEWIRRIKDEWRQPVVPLTYGTVNGNGDDDDNGDDDLPPGVDPVEFARAQMIRRNENAYRPPVVWRGVAAGPHQYSGPSDYARGVWEAQNAIDPRSPNVWSQVEAARRKTTRESTTDAGDDRARAYAEYCSRISADWMR
jgi:hypothetical protein